MSDCAALEAPPASIAGPVLYDSITKRRTLLVTPRGDDRLVAGVVHNTMPLDVAVERLEANVTLRMLPGKYYRAVEIQAKKGDAEAPIVIEGVLETGAPQTHICGTNAAGSIYPKLPDRDDYAFFKLIKCEHVVFKDFQFESCWPSFIYAEASSYLTIKNVHGQDGSYGVFLRGPGARGLEVADSSWTQDPTGTLWSTIDWGQSHHGGYAYYNGAFVGGVDHAGDIVIRGNSITHAYNGVRFATSETARSAILHRFNVNVQIFENHFENIRDNAIEPEQTLLNWHIHDNWIKNVHAAFSMHDFYGGYLYIYGNFLWFDDRGGADYQDNRGGKIYKLRHKGPLPEKPIHVFHNSMYTRTYLIKKARTVYFSHRNNAVEFCSPADHADCLCMPDRAMTQDFPVVQTAEGVEPSPWEPSVRFENDACNRVFQQGWPGTNPNVSIRVLPDLGFVDAAKGKLALKPESLLRTTAKPFTLRENVDLTPGQNDWTSARNGAPPLHIGAWQDDEKITLPFVRAAILD